MLSFQDIISTLTHFWAHEGCIVHQPHDIETGAGTFNPATFLKVLGPEPYSCVYVEPSKRPQDGRYGDNPNRTQQFHQLQVIMKPSPLNIQELYLKSLELIGFDLSQHDIRFVHDDWESPTLGAWGLGWEVWIDGMEVTQFTYFQSVAGITLDPISVEITYGLERLCMLAQKKNNFFEMMYNNKLNYGDVFHRNEVEFSTYNFEHASIEMWQKHFEDFEAEAQKLTAANLPLPAYDFVIKASHAFNMLEARGAISTTERMRIILRIRNLSAMVAKQYVESREKQGFPLLKYLETPPISQPQPLQIDQNFDPKIKEDFLLEIGSEQLPATYIEPSTQMLKQKIEKLLNDHKLEYGEIETYCTPQRIAIKVKSLIAGSAEETITRKGPPLSGAFDDNGSLTKMGQGFFKSIKQDETSLADIQNGKNTIFSIESIKGIDYLFVTLKTNKCSTVEILHKELPLLIQKLTFEKNMRWASFQTTYARPLKWILALFGSQLIPFAIDGIESESKTWGHAQRANHKIAISHPDEYVKKLKTLFVLANSTERRETILEQLKEIEKETKTKAVNIEKVMKEVLYLTEWPLLTYTSFDEKFLIAPKELLVSEMIEHQRYFPLEDKDQKLKNIFIITADNKVNDEIRENNQKVLSARLSDGVFLYEFDLRTKLENFNEKLKKVTFQKDLGSVYDKVLRVKKMALLLSDHLSDGEAGTLVRASTLCKSDLASELTQEFPDLQGIIGKHYALAQGESEEVALAIEQHWLPNSENGPLPTTLTGSILALADKMDNLISYFSVGLKPSSSSDPFALRRQTLGILKILIHNKWSLNLKQIFNQAYSENHDGPSGEVIIQEILDFFKNRTKTVFLLFDLDKDAIESALSQEFVNPYEEFCKVQALQAFKSTKSFSPLLQVYKRAKGQIDNHMQMTLNPTFLKEESEIELHKSLENVGKNFILSYEKKEFEKCFKLLSTLQKPLASLYEEVKILSDDENERTNRIAMLQEVFGYFAKMLDFSKIKG
ncbi:MAG: glycine--tRNA ligase subunit beta [Rhabdochlamydiaceae bacterium]|nr:glycine--tRNA ligase subunit beta [Candidatus Amphrikana amoebophyrae]